MFTEGIFPIGDGLLDIDEKRLKGLLVTDDINEIYEVEQAPFARGKFAAVRRAIHKNSGVHFAAKFLKRRRRAQSSDKEIKHEIAVLILCEGEENIVKLNAVHETRSDTALLLDLATGGELQTILDNEECLTEYQARICMRAVLKALQFLHKRSIAHLDLKPQNILLNGDRVEDGLKLCDFGISRVVAEGTNIREIVGTPDYVAPEVLQYEPLSLQTDIWSVGVLAYVLLSGFSPFGGDNKQETYLNISQCALNFPEKLFEGVSSAAIDFITKALRLKPSDRMTAAGCLDHHWLKDECSLDRQIFLKPHQVNVNDLTVKGEDDDEEEEEEVEEEEELEEDGVHDISIDDDDEEEEEDSIVNDHKDQNSSNDNNLTNGCTKMDSSDIENDFDFIKSDNKNKNKTNPFLNGLMESSSTSSSTTIIKSTKQNSSLVVDGGKLSSSSSSSSSQKPLATATLTLPPSSRALSSSSTATTTIPIPLFNFQSSEDSPKPHSLTSARRQGSDSNKENTFLSLKKISATPSSGSLKKPPTPTTPVTSITTSTATILLGGSSSPEKDPILVVNGSSIVATITLPNASSSSSSSCSTEKATKNLAQQCVFPDAPTTPKVIRKAPTTDTSPTSVKALVKKFQLEESPKPTQQNSQAQHLKESHLNQQQHQPHLNGHHHHQQQVVLGHPPLPHQHLGNGFAAGSRRSSLNSSPAANEKASSQKSSNTSPASSRKSNNGFALNHNNNNNHNSHNNNNNNSSYNNKEASINGSRLFSNVSMTRRASEPITGVHKKSSTVTVAPRHSVASSSSSSAGSYKSSCVLGLGCNGGGKSSSSSPVANTSECRHSSSPPQTNGSVGSSSSSSSASSSTAAAAILINSHQQLHLQHHHHHHPHHHHHLNGVAKNATNNLSMDQGIIC